MWRASSTTGTATSLTCLGCLHCLAHVCNFIPVTHCDVLLQTVRCTAIRQITHTTWWSLRCHRALDCSCDGGNMNLEVVRSRGRALPHVALFANRHIRQGEELTFSYGAPCSGVHPPVSQQPFLANVDLQKGPVMPSSTVRNRRACMCGTPACLGFLPGS